MAEPTPAQLAQFAELIGITPDTHRHLRKMHPRVMDDRYWQEIDPEKLPPLDTPEGDDVYLAAFLRWCGGITTKRDMWIEQWASNLTTIDLLERCQSAGVPEVVAIFGEGE